MRCSRKIAQLLSISLHLKIDIETGFPIGRIPGICIKDILFYGNPLNQIKETISTGLISKIKQFIDVKNCTGFRISYR
jgi:hypothetical protein